jgi:hypothetical protein
VKNIKSAATKLAGIEYYGVAGSSLDCQEAIVGLISSGRRLLRARVLTFGSTHCLFLMDEAGDYIAIKSGFASGYSGTGPRCFSFVLQLLATHGCELSEGRCSRQLIERLDQSALTIKDIKSILETRPIRPTRLYDYIHDSDHDAARSGALWDNVNVTMPFALIDHRLFDRALAFASRPDHVLISGYRSLEDRVRKRARLKDHGQKLFAKAFQDRDAPLYWKGIDDAERIGRAQLFTGAYMAHRNPRAHSNRSGSAKAYLSEFLILNHLFLLEQDALGPRKKRKTKSDT